MRPSGLAVALNTKIKVAAPVNDQDVFLSDRTMCSVAGCYDPAIWVSSTSGFHRLLATKPIRSETSKAERAPVASIVLSGTRGPSLFLVIRSPGVIKPATVINEIFSQEDTLLAAAGESNVVQKLEQGYKANGKTGKIHLDGYNFLPYFKGETKNGPAKQSCTWAKAGELNAVGGMTGK